MAARTTSSRIKGEGVKIEREVDVCILGLGGVGAVAAYRLALAGRQILALEAGPRHIPHQGGVNPTLTLQALALRSAMHIAGTTLGEMKGELRNV